MQANTTNPILGASLLAAAASMPSNVMPRIVTAIASEGRLPLGLVGLIATNYMLGQFAMAVMLPIMKIAAINRGAAFFAVILLLLSLFIASNLTGPLLLLPWFFIGCACGTLQFLAYGNYKNDKLDALAAAASKEPDPARAQAAHQSRPARARRAGAPRSPAPPDDPLGHAQQCDGGAPGRKLAGVAVGGGWREAWNSTH